MSNIPRDVPTKTIIVVDDDFGILQLLKEGLGGAGYRVIPAYGGDDAVSKVKAYKADVLVTDLAMTRVSGVEVIQRIRDDPETRKIAVIVVTAHVWDGLAQAAGQVGYDACITKPFTTKQLLSTIRQCLDR